MMKDKNMLKKQVKGGEIGLASKQEQRVDFDGITSSSITLPFYPRSRSKSSVSYVESKVPSEDSNLTSSLINRFQMPQNFTQVLPNINMPSLPEYFSQLPSMREHMPNISIPNLPMPSLPNLSMPNISMPNLNIPSISDIMSFPGRKPLKSWEHLSMAVKDSRKRFSEICPPLPFNYRFYRNVNSGNLRLYFLFSKNGSDATFYYCDILLKKELTEVNEDREIFDFEESEKMSLCNIEANREVENLNSELILTDTRYAKANNLEESMNHNISIEDDYENEDNLSLPSSPRAMSSISLSSSQSSTDSYSPLLLRKSMTSPTLSTKSLQLLEWKPLIQAKGEELAQSTSSGRSVSREEDLFLQRKRMMQNGIVSFDFHPNAARFVYTNKNSLYWFDDGEMASQRCLSHQDSCPESTAVQPQWQLGSKPPYLVNQISSTRYVKLNATMCPFNADLVAYVADNDLWVCDLLSRKEVRLTSTQYTETSIIAGRPSFVMQEEFSRFIGFWWRPWAETDCEYTILCEFVDESNVEPTSIWSWDSLREIHRFPKAGGANAKSTLKLVHFSRDFNESHIENIPASLESLYEHYEYLIRCGWHSYDVIWAQLLSRRQNQLAIVLISVSNRFPAQIIYEELHKDHWYNCHDVLYFYKMDCNPDDSDCDKRENSTLSVGDQIRFLWSSELSGFRHLYHITVELVGERAQESDSVKNRNNAEVNTESGVQPEASQKSLRAISVSVRQITSGNWEVSDLDIWVDEQKELIYFMSNKHGPLEWNLYVVSSTLSSRIVPRLLTQEDFTHTDIIFDPELQFCLDFRSNISTPPHANFYQVLHSQESSVCLEPFCTFFPLLHEIQDNEDPHEYLGKVEMLGPTPQLFEHKLKSGELIFGFLFKPPFMDPSVKYPVLVEVYGGPEVQLVSKSFKDLRQHRRHLIASEGYVVVGFDSRGSKHRGVDFEKHIYKRLGQVEIDDQVEALQWLALNTGFIDMSRVAIHGWSYGGYLSLMALAQRPDVFKCAIAGAPVTNWRLYDTAYTERYMGLPDENQQAYKMSSVLTHAKNFPTEFHRLLIIHSLMDENVHFDHTAQLIQALVMLGKPYSLNIFPSERHSFRKSQSSEHYEVTLLYYLQQNL